LSSIRVERRWRGHDPHPDQAPLVSIVINNYNYARFLGQAIESALNQSYAPIEVVVVDDGSTDRSPQVIAGYGSNILPVLKENGGQASAFNAGVSSSHGDIICLLDADDLFYPDKVKEIVSVFSGAGDTSKPLFVAHWLEVVDREGVASGRKIGGMGKSPFNLYAYAKRYKFTYAPCGPTTGMSFNRALACRVFPLPEGLKVAADDFVRRAASLIADCYTVDMVLGGYRVHGNNTGYGSPEERTGPAGHFDCLQDYLNRILVESNLEPIISFYDSMYFCSYLADKGRWSALPKQMLRALVRHPDLHTMRFMYLLVRDVVRQFQRGRLDLAQTK
jgi:Glycosyltransferases involved in cell wall biogenesis